MKAVLALALMAVPLLANAQDASNEAAGSSRLKHLAGAIKAYQILHDKKPPAKLSDLYRDGLADSFGDFVRPGSATVITMDSEIDAKSDYTLESLPDVKDILVREKTAEAGKDKLLAVFQDGSIKPVPAPGGAAAAVSPPVVAATSAVPESPPQNVAAASASIAPSPATAITPVSSATVAAPAVADSSEAAATMSGTASAADSRSSEVAATPAGEQDLVTVPSINGADNAAAAGSILHQAGFKPVFKALKPSYKINEFKFAGQSPRPGEMKPRGSVVTVYVYQKYEEPAASAGDTAASAGAELSKPAATSSSTPELVRQTTPPPLGSFSSSVTRNMTPPPGPGSASANNSQTDLVNPQQKIVGTWQGPRHRKEYRADGTFVTDPHLVPNAPVCQWSVKGDRLTEHYSSVGDVNYRIVLISGQELVIANDKGVTFRATRIPDDQAAREQAKW